MPNPQFHPEGHMRGRVLMDIREDKEFNGRLWPWTKILSELPYMKLVEDCDLNAIKVAEKILNAEKPKSEHVKIGIMDIKGTEDDTEGTDKPGKK